MAGTQEHTSENALTELERQRYIRHLSLPQIGVAGQLKLKAAKVLIIGLGGLGSPVALYLAAAGVGELGLWDFDVVDVSNLQRQILYSEADIGLPKALQAASRLGALNSHLRLTAFTSPLTAAAATAHWPHYDLIIDATDNDAAHYLINDLCCLYARPNLAAAVYQFEGRLSLFQGSGGPCYRCVYPVPPPAAQTANCNEAGVLGVLPGTLGMLQATEALKYVLGLGRSLAGRYLIFDALNMSFKEWPLKARSDCPSCQGSLNLSSLLATVNHAAATAADDEIAPAAFDDLRRQPGTLLLDVRSAEEAAADHIPGAQILPLPELITRSRELNPEALILIYCATGRRSATAVQLLRQEGFLQVKSLRGGLERWHAYKR